VAEAKDLNPRRVRLFTYTRGLSSPFAHGPQLAWYGQGRRSASLSAPYRERPTVLVIRAS